MSTFGRYLLALSLTAAATSCGPSVKPISLHDPVVPVESRRYVADTQDAVSIARANRDEADRELDRVNKWYRDVVRGIEWPGSAKKAVGRLELLALGRVKLAQLELDRANATLDLAEAKYVLVTAETAIRHDLASYELEPLRDDTDDARKRSQALLEKIITQRDKNDKLTTKWWDAYSSWAASGGDTRRYYVPFIDVDSPTKKKKKKKLAQKDEQKDDPKKKKKKKKKSGKDKDQAPLRIW